MLEKLRKYAVEREPLAVVNGVAAAITAAVSEWQGDLTGEHAWLAVGWGLILFVSRQVVSPAKRSDVG